MKPPTSEYLRTHVPSYFIQKILSISWKKCAVARSKLRPISPGHTLTIDLFYWNRWFSLSVVAWICINLHHNSQKKQFLHINYHAYPLVNWHSYAPWPMYGWFKYQTCLKNNVILQSILLVYQKIHQAVNNYSLST